MQRLPLPEHELEVALAISMQPKRDTVISRSIIEDRIEQYPDTFPPLSSLSKRVKRASISKSMNRKYKYHTKSTNNASWNLSHTK